MSGHTSPRLHRLDTFCVRMAATSGAEVGRPLLPHEFLDDTAELCQVHVTGLGGRDAMRSWRSGARQAADRRTVEIPQHSTGPDFLVLGDEESRDSSDARPLRQELAVGI